MRWLPFGTALFFLASGCGGEDPTRPETPQGQPGPIAPGHNDGMGSDNSGNPDPVWMDPDPIDDPDPEPLPQPEPPGDPRAALERRVLELVNRVRAAGTECDGVPMPPVGPVAHHDLLREAARGHSEDMGRRGFFAHDNPDGEGPGARVEQTGYRYQSVGENIAAGYETPEEVMQGWIDSPGHCLNIMRSNWTELGVGYAARDGSQYYTYWTQKFARPR
jgi:uncharacterized protein YkwD